MPVVDSWPLFALNAEFFAMSLDCDSGTNILGMYQLCIRIMFNIKISLYQTHPYERSEIFQIFWNILYTGCLKKNVVSWKNSHNYPQTHPKCKSRGCFGKFRIFATKWALRFSKLKKKWLRKWSIKLPTPPPKMVRIFCSQYAVLWCSSAFSWLFETLCTITITLDITDNWIWQKE